MITLNQIKRRLLAWFESHAQINSTTSFDDFEFEAERNLAYPVANVEYLLSNIDDKFINYTFFVKVGDLAGDNVSHQDEVVSDAILIADDFFSYLQDEEGWVFRRSSTLDTFKDDGGDRVTGIMFRVVLGVVRSHNTCQTPTKDLLED